tara:strand:- start:8626 stop:9078 length:453 start_codon:yes stop_codon:yes gene_type:complete
MEKIDHPFVQKFSDFWAAPTLEGVSTLVHDDAIFIQPLTKPLLTTEYHNYFKSVMKVSPDIHGEVIRYSESKNPDGLFIHWIMKFSIGSYQKEVSAVDIIQLSGGKVTNRIVHMDLLPVLGSILISPKVWFKWAKFIIETSRLKSTSKVI